MAMYGNTIGEKTLTDTERDVISGLLKRHKQIPTRYLYDDEGSQIFQEIMDMDEYYPTDCELEILQNQSAKIIAATKFNQNFNIVELGAGDGYKTKELLRYLTAHKTNFTYFPIDISAGAMEALELSLQRELPGIKINPQVGDYFKVLSQADFGRRPSLFLLLGGNIGNYERYEAQDLLTHLGNHMQPGDCILIGFDLKKNPHVIRTAYDDPHGITARFNLNLLTRMNRELGADFCTDDFGFYCNYEPRRGEVRSYLFSKREQTVYFAKAEKAITFEKDESIFTELSKKYSVQEIESMAELSGFRFKRHFFDSKRYFVDSLWQKAG